MSIQWTCHVVVMRMTYDDPVRKPIKLERVMWEMVEAKLRRLKLRGGFIEYVTDLIQKDINGDTNVSKRVSIHDSRVHDKRPDNTLLIGIKTAARHVGWRNKQGRGFSDWADQNKIPFTLVGARRAYRAHDLDSVR